MIKAIRERSFGTPRELFALLHARQGEFTPWDVGYTWSTLRRIVENKGRLFRRGKDVSVSAPELDLLIKTTTRLASRMNGQDVANTLWAMSALGECGVTTDPAAVTAVTNEATRLAGAENMNACDVSMTLLALGNMASRGANVSEEAVAAVSKEATRTAKTMMPRHVADAIWAFGKLADKGVSVDATAVKAVTGQTQRVSAYIKTTAVRKSTKKLNAEDMSHMRWARAKLADNGVTVFLNLGGGGAQRPSAGAEQKQFGGAARSRHHWLKNKRR